MSDKDKSGAESRIAYETELDPQRSTHLGIWRDEHDELTRTFFDWEVPGLPEQVRDAIAPDQERTLRG